MYIYIYISICNNWQQAHPIVYLCWSNIKDKSVYIYIFINQQLDVFESMAAWHDDPNGLVNFFESNGLVSHFFWVWNY